MSSTSIGIITWNVNGLRPLASPPVPGGALRPILDKLNASIICFQETKLTRKALNDELALVEGYDAYFSFSQEPNYSGVATYVRKQVVTSAAAMGLAGCCSGPNRVKPSTNTDISCPFACAEFQDRWEEFVRDSPDLEDPASLLRSMDNEGRCVITDHGVMVVVNVYVPFASGEEPARVLYKRAFLSALRLRCEALVSKGRQVILAGDLNAQAARIDSCCPGPDFEQRASVQWMQSIVGQPSPLFIDTFRALHPTLAEAYTCWNVKTGARQTNYGTRIDYILATPGLCGNGPGRVVSSTLLTSQQGSDHCPTRTEFDLPSTILQCRPPYPPPPPLCACYYPELQGCKQGSLLTFLSRPSSGPTKEVDPSPSPSPSPPPLGPAVRMASCFASSSLFSGSSVNTGKNYNRKRKQPSSSSSSSSKHKQRAMDTFLKRSTASSSSTATPSINGIESENTMATVVVDPPPPPSSPSITRDRFLQAFKQPPIPKCQHGEPAVERVVKLDNENKGRRFYVCNRPDGPKSNPLSRCDFFQWRDPPKRWKGPTGNTTGLQEQGV